MPFLAEAAGPDDLRLYAVGDVHGRLDLLRDLHARVASDLIARPCRRFRVIHLGDYIDRGPDSRGVVDHLIEFRRDGDAVCLAGNHDLYLPAFLRDPRDIGEHWFSFGGVEAVRSWGVEGASPRLGGKAMKALRDAFAAALTDAQRAFFETLPFCERHGDFLFVHAGVRPGVALDKQKVADLTYIREPFLTDERDHGAVVVHGHTITPRPAVRRNRVGIDTKAYGGGPLTCFVVDGPDKGFLEPEGYVPLDPASLPR
jgi:serine/threonine protein phosphatase 1